MSFTVGMSEKDLIGGLLNLASGPITVTTFTSSGTWTCPAGVYSVIVDIYAGGGSGASSNTTSGGGQGGSTSKKTGNLFSVTPGTAYTITVGAGGASVTSVAGNAGGSSSFGGLLSVPGGMGGTYNGTPGIGKYDGEAGGFGASSTSGIGRKDLYGSGGDGAINSAASGSGSSGAVIIYHKAVS